MSIEIDHVNKHFRDFVAVDNVSLTFRDGELTALLGPSGSGKSTLMHTMAGLDSATSGSAFIGDTDMSHLNDKEITALRRDRLGFIFQSFNLLPTLTAEENITLPQDIAGHTIDRAWFDEVIGRLGMEDQVAAFVRTVPVTGEAATRAGAGSPIGSTVRPYCSLSTSAIAR